MNEDQILSEYIDNELPPDLARRVEQRFEQDPGFRARYESMLHLRTILKADSLDSVMLADMQAHVWQQIQRRAGTRQRPFQVWLENIGEALHRRIALPLPALAAMLVVFLVLGVVAITRGSGDSSGAIAANQSAQMASPVSINNGQSLISQPSSLGAMPLASNNLTAAGFKLDSSSDGFANDRAMEVTIQVQNLRQLVTLLEKNQDIHQLTIQLPKLRNLSQIGDYSEQYASGLGVSDAMANGIQVGQP